MKKLILICLITFGCKKQQPLIDAIAEGAKLTKADAGKQVNDWGGVWWLIGNQFTDSLVIEFKTIKFDTTYYESNSQLFNPVLKHKNPYIWKDDFLVLTVNGRQYTFRH